MVKRRAVIEKASILCFVERLTHCHQEDLIPCHPTGVTLKISTMVIKDYVYPDPKRGISRHKESVRERKENILAGTWG
jgi:hypothetical protein